MLQNNIRLLPLHSFTTVLFIPKMFKKKNLMPEAFKFWLYILAKEKLKIAFYLAAASCHCFWHLVTEIYGLASTNTNVLKCSWQHNCKHHWLWFWSGTGFCFKKRCQHTVRRLAKVCMHTHMDFWERKNCKVRAQRTPIYSCLHSQDNS